MAKTRRARDILGAAPRNGGTVSTSKASRSSKSARELPAAVAVGRSRWWRDHPHVDRPRSRPLPIRSNSPIRSPSRNLLLDPRRGGGISSMNTVPRPPARSARAARTAPGEAPASWPNSSLSSRSSTARRNYLRTNPPPAAATYSGRRRCRYHLLPFPPPARDHQCGRSSGATREACSSIATKPGVADQRRQGRIVIRPRCGEFNHNPAY